MHLRETVRFLPDQTQPKTDDTIPQLGEYSILFSEHYVYDDYNYGF
jgi:hypothetical protein